jgi:predicted DNA-binding protein (MmcQ/YjbR family)
MNIDQLRDYCLSKKEASEDFPFDEDTLVFKVLGKMFALVPLERWERGEPSINLKCNPEYALELREQYESIYAGFHMNKKHWNTVNLNNGELQTKFIFELIDHSYDMVVKGMTKKMREQLNS